MPKYIDFTGEVNLQGRSYKITVINDEVVDLTPWTPTDQAKQQAGTNPQAGDQVSDQSDSQTGELNKIKIDPVFKQRLQSVLIDNLYNRQLPKRKRGKLDMKHLWRGSTGVSNLFTQKQARKGKHYNVVLVADQSGSMRGRKIETATVLALFLGKHFEELNIDFGVIGFGDKAGVHKQINQKIDDSVADKLLDLENTGLGEGTNLSTGLRLATEQLKNRAGRNLIIVISDGQTERWQDCRAILHANPDIKAFGVGIDTPCDVIPQNKVIYNLDELKPTIINWLGKNIRRGF